MSKSNSWESGLVRLVLQNATFGNGTFGIDGKSSGSIHISLHTSDPGEAGDQTTNEATYTGYGRVSVNQTSAEWGESGGVGSNRSTLTFGACTAGSNTITHFGLGTAPSGAGVLLYSGALTQALAVSAGITPRVLSGSLSITET